MNCIFLSFIIICLTFSSINGQSIAKPIFTYLTDFSMSDTLVLKLNGPARIINFDGRKGLNMTSIRSVLELKSHNLKSDEGTVTMWVMSLEELSAYDPRPAFSMDNPHLFIYPILSDCSDPQDFERANFKLIWWPRWQLIETVNKEYTNCLLDSQVYVWSNRTFEGNLYVEYEFKVLHLGGLSLLMVQASGMNREDFMADYPLKTIGRMTTVYGEAVRNYHWEYYREMADMRNDLENSALIKNPFLYPLSLGAKSTPVEKNVWHKLQFLQIGNKLVGAIDGIIMVAFTDDGFSNNGPVYDFGRIAICCMLRSKLLFRNIKVYN